MPKTNNNYAAFAITARRCRVCQSPLRPQIDDMLLGETRRDDDETYRYAEIMAWAAERGLAISESGLSRHYQNHVQPGVRAMLETQAHIDGIAESTGKKLSIPEMFANIVTMRVMRRLDQIDDADLGAVELDKLIRLGLQAGRNSLQIQKAEHALKPDEVAEAVGAGLAKRGISPEAIAQIKQEIYGLGQ